jgi:Zn-dependent protease with chaperone function
MCFRFPLGIAVLAALLASAPAAQAQTPAGRPFERRDAYVLAFTAPYQTIRLDVGENPISTDFVVEAKLHPGTVIEDARGKPVGPEAIVPGMEVSVRGEAGSGGAVVSSLRLRTRLESWAGEADGVLERVEGGAAVIEGRRVVMAEGRSVAGEGAWRRRTFASFAEIPLGSWVELRGRRGADGTLVADQGKARPNEYSGTEREIHEALRRGLVPPPAAQLSGGRMKIGQQEYRLVQDRALQAYVTRVGTRLIPRWMDELAENDPAKITFRFYVIDDSTFNAAAYPDGTVIIHTGLLRVIGGEAQLAAVLGHEIGHVTHEHGRRRLEDHRNRAVGGMVLGAVLSQVGGKGDGRAAMELAAELGLGAMANSYSRDHESQADRVGLAYMVAAGYDPREAAAVWRRLAEETRPSNAVAGALQRAETFLFSSHPAALSRVRNINREIAANYSTLDFARLKTGEAEYRRAVAGLGRR